MTEQVPGTCLLCGLLSPASFFKDRNRLYHHCVCCDLIYVDKAFHLDALEEKDVYDQHENDSEDVGYRKFLGRLFDPLESKLEKGARGLDFGSGPGPTLSLMFSEAGYDMYIYDKFYAADESVFQESYDFISSTEVIEHLDHPKRELDRLWSCLKPGGYLGLMTKLATGEKSFPTWHYKNDPTHIAFYSKASFAYLAEKLNASLEFFGTDVIILRKEA